MTQPTKVNGVNGHGAVTLYEPDEAQGVSLRTIRLPDEVMADAVVVAKLLNDVVTQRGLFTVISGKKHLKVEAWMTCGTFYGVTVGCTHTAPISIGDDIGWEAHATATRVADGQVLSEADGMCMTDESRWRERATYKNGKFDGMEPVSHQARRSMAQTRAMSKALASLFRWVAVLAGYEPTPAEEMPAEEMQGINEDGGDTRKERPRRPEPPKRRGKPASQQRIKEVFERLKAAGVSRNDICAVLDCDLSVMRVRLAQATEAQCKVLDKLSTKEN